MADTAAGQLAAIDTVVTLLDQDSATDRRALYQLRTLRRRIEARATQDEAIGKAFAASTGLADPPAYVGALIRAAVEATGATITPPPAPDCAPDPKDTANA